MAKAYVQPGRQIHGRRVFMALAEARAPTLLDGSVWLPARWHTCIE